MGLLTPLLELLLWENSFKKIEGDVLFIGRQTVFLDEHSLERLLRKHGLTNQTKDPIEYDSETVGAQGSRYITDRYLMKALGVPNVKFMDVTDYEGADIIHDLGYPIDERYHNSFDFIYNGGCLDNMFNPGVALMSLSKMLRPGGRVVCMESASSWNGPYLMYSPGWFHDYYVANGFADCQVYIASYHDNTELMHGPWELSIVNIDRDQNGRSPEAIHNNHLLVISIAEKGADSTSEVQPIQYQYRKDPAVAAKFDQNAAIIRQSRRNKVLHKDGDGYLTLLGTLGTLGEAPAISKVA